jgi:hypothetical protein
MKGLLRTLGAGLLLALLVKPPAAWRVRPASHFWWLLLPTIGLSVLRDFLLQSEPASFYADGVQSDALGALLLLASAAAIGAWSGQRVLTWSLAVLASAMGLWISAFMLAVRLGMAQWELLDADAEWGLLLATCAWWLLCLLRLLATLLPGWRWWQQSSAAVLAATLTIAPFLAVDTARYWYPDYDDSQETARQVQGSAEALMYRQPAMVEQALAQLAPGTPGVTDAYLLAFGADGNEDVFRNEVDFAQTLFTQRFGMQQRTLALLNHPDTTGQLPLATLTNLRQALAGIGARMNRDEDLLVLFMTTHGSEDHQLFVDLKPLPLDWIGPADLRSALDAAAIDWRVVIVSACYSGGFIEALAHPMSMTITAARADRPSFGCGADAELTYFGRAFLVEALNRTTSIPIAFEMARERVLELERADDFDASFPQIDIGALIGQRLASWESQLPPAAPVAFVPAVPKTACDKDKEPCP